MKVLVINSSPHMDKGKISAETLKTVCRELMPMKTYFENANQGFQQTLDTREKK